MKLFWDIIDRMPNAEAWRNGGKVSYLVADFETTGFDHVINRINQFGYLLVKDGVGELSDAKHVYIKTKYNARVYSAVHATRGNRRMRFLTMVRKAGCDLTKIKAAIDDNDGSIVGLGDLIPQEIIDLKQEGKDKRYFTVPVDVTHIRSKTTMEKGKDRKDAIGNIARLFQMMDKKKWPLVGHNFSRFDVPFIEYEAKEFCGIDLKIDQDLIIDTGMIVKANQCRMSLNKKETLGEFYRRAADRRSKVAWSLDTYCHEEYKLHKYGVDPALQHEADYDCWVNDCLLRELSK